MAHKNHIIKRNNNYYFNKRVPIKYSKSDPRKHIRISLDTDSFQQALANASIINKNLSEYWKNLMFTGKTYDTESYRNALHLCELIGFNYIPSQELKHRPLEELLARAFSIKEATVENQNHVNVLLGNVEKTGITLKQGLEKYWDYTKDRVMKKNADKIRKWRNPRIKAVNNLISVLNSDKEIEKLDRDDFLLLKDWWIERIKNDNLNKSSANKDFVHLKDILKVLRQNLKLKIKVNELFEDLLFKQSKQKSRLPFKSDFIVNVLLNDEILNKCDLDEEQKYFLYAMAETGARPVELAMLTANNIFLDGEIPFIRITPDDEDDLKTEQSERDIPLVGYALDAFKRFPNGFEKWYKRNDQLSTRLNKTLRDNNVYPSPKHSLYSLRHSFSDRLVAAKAGDKLHTQLMGHEFGRPDYGDGAELDLKYEYMQKIQLKPNNI